MKAVNPQAPRRTAVAPAPVVTTPVAKPASRKRASAGAAPEEPKAKKTAQSIYSGKSAPTAKAPKARAPKPPKPRRQRQPEPPADDDDDRQDDDEDDGGISPPGPVMHTAPQQAYAPPPFNMAALLSQAAGVMSLQSLCDSGGSYFVRMVSSMNHTRAIPVDQVPSCLCRGWRFIEGEPVIPRAHCDADKMDTPDVKGRPFPRALQHNPTLARDACIVWFQEFVKDLQAFGGNHLLDYGYINRLISQIKEGQNQPFGAGVYVGG